MDVLARLSADHDALRTYLEHIASAAEAQDAAALSAGLEVARAALTDELDAHIALEEADVFSPVAESLGDGLLAPFHADHVEIRALRDSIYTAIAQGKAPYELSLHLCELILMHQQREDLILFPSARDALV